jgi:hypothetical protein
MEQELTAGLRERQISLSAIRVENSARPVRHKKRDTLTNATGNGIYCTGDRRAKSAAGPASIDRDGKPIARDSRKMAANEAFPLAGFCI